MTITRRALPAAAALLALALAACSSSGGTVDTSSAPAPSAPSTALTTSAPPTSAPTSSSPSTPAGTSATTTSSPTTSPVPSTPLRTVTVTGATNVSYVVKVWATRRDTTCHDHAYGQPIITFLTQHPCSGMTRSLATTTVGGRAVGLSIVTTSFVGTAKNPYAYASAFRVLVDKDGTGSIDDLLRDGYRLPSGPTQVPSPDAFACLIQDNGVSIYDMWYLDGPTPENTKPLETLAQDIFLQV